MFTIAVFIVLFNLSSKKMLARTWDSDAPIIIY